METRQVHRQAEKPVPDKVYSYTTARSEDSYTCSIAQAIREQRPRPGFKQTSGLMGRAVSGDPDETGQRNKDLHSEPWQVLGIKTKETKGN